MKLALAAASVAVLALAVLLLDRPEPERASAERDSAVVEERVSESGPPALARPDGTSTNRTDEGPIERDASEATEADALTAELRVVSRGGSAIPGARGAWVDAQKRVLPLAFDTSGVATRPSPERGHVYVTAPGYMGRAIGVDASETDGADLVLEPSYRLSGVVRVDGEAPGAAFDLELVLAPEQVGAWYGEERIWDELLPHGAPPTQRTVAVQADGSLEIEVDWDLLELPLRPPPAFRVVRVQGEPPRYGPDLAVVPRGARALALELERVAAVVGAVAWENGDAFAGADLALLLVWPGGSPTFRVTARADENGRFFFGLGDHAGPSKSGSGARAHRATLTVTSRTCVHDAPRTIELGERAATIDVGTITVRPRDEVEVEVLGRERAQLEPIAGATVTTGFGTGATDRGGRVTLPFDPKVPIRVLAGGHRPVELEVPVGERVARVVLDRTPDLRVEVEPPLPETRPGETFEVWLRFRESPFGVGDVGTNATRTNLGPLRARQGGDLRGWTEETLDVWADGVVHFRAPSGEPLIVSGLRPGADFDVELVDPIGNVVARRRPTIETKDVTLVFDTKDVAFTTFDVELRWADGGRIDVPDASITVRPAEGGVGEGRVGVDDGVARIGPVAAAPVAITTQVLGAVNVTLENVDVADRDEPVTIALERAKR